MRTTATISMVCVLAACSAGASGPAADRRSPPAPAPIRCGDDIGVHDPPSDEAYAIVDDAVALPSTDKPALRAVPVDESGVPDSAEALPEGEWWWAKQGLAVRRGQRIRLWVAPRVSDDMRIGWGHAPVVPSTSVQADCSSAADWLAFPGGYWVRQPGCYAIYAQVGTGPALRTDVGIGAPCPGQEPPLIHEG